MTTRNSVRAACAAILLVIAALVAWELVLANRAESEEEEAQSRHARMLKDLDGLRASIARERQDHSGIHPTATVDLLKSVDTPKVLRGRLGILSAWMSLRYSRLYRKAGFTPGQIQQFEALLEDHYLRNFDIAATARAQGIPSSDPAITQLLKVENDRFSAAEIATLGSQLTSAITEDQRTATVRGMADAVAGSTYYTEPMAANQADQLTQILANNSPSYAQGKTATIDDLNMDAALAQAQAVLSPAQLAALKNLYYGNQSGKALDNALAAATQAKSN